MYIWATRATYNNMDQAINIAWIYSLQMNFLLGLKQSYMTLSATHANTRKFKSPQIDATI